MGDQAGDQRQAKLEFGDLTAEAKVYEVKQPRCARTRCVLCRTRGDRRGWRGKKEWEALGLRLAAQHDGLGHVTLDVTLEADYASADRWRVGASLALDAGALDRLVPGARALDQR